jgi:hypothetical protein
MTLAKGGAVLGTYALLLDSTTGATSPQAGILRFLPGTSLLDSEDLSEYV